MNWTRLLPIVSIAATLPVARAAAQETDKPTPPPTTEQQYQSPQFPVQQRDSTQQNWYQQRMDALLKGITLTTQQRAKVDSIQLKYKEQLPPMPDQAQRPNDPNNPSNAIPGNPTPGNPTPGNPTPGSRNPSDTANRSNTNPSNTNPSNTNPNTTLQQPDSVQQSMLLMVLERQDKEVRAALKPDQQKVWDKNKNEWKQKRTPVG